MMRLILITFLILTGSLASAEYTNDYSSGSPFSVDIQYNSYSDIVSNPETIKVELNDTVNINLNGRFYRIFSFTGIYGFTSNNDLHYYGLGFRVDLPGIFFFGGVPSDFVRKQKARRVNTYFQASKVMVSDDSFTKRYIDDKLAFGLDAFVVSNIYLNFEMGLLSHRGNQFLSPAIGIGYEF